MFFKIKKYICDQVQKLVRRTSSARPDLAIYYLYVQKLLLLLLFLPLSLLLLSILL